MVVFANYLDKVKKHFNFSKEEINGLVVSIIIIGFIVSFRDWVITPEGGLDSFITLRNIFNGIIVACLVLLIYETGHRLIAIGKGFEIKSKLWWPGIIVGLILAFATKGWLWLIIAPSVFIHHLHVHRLGRFRYGRNLLDNGFICLAGPVAMIIFAFIVKILLIYLPANVLLLKTLYVSLWFAAVNMLPIPPLDGSRVFFMPGGPLIYAYSFFTVVGLAIFLALPITQLGSVLLLLLGGLVVGVLGWFYILQRVMK